MKIKVWDKVKFKKNLIDWKEYDHITYREHFKEEIDIDKDWFFTVEKVFCDDTILAWDYYLTFDMLEKKVKKQK